LSKVKIKGNASGTGTLTLTAPNTNSDRIHTLPDVDGTLVANTSTGIDVTGSITFGDNHTFSADGDDNLEIASSTGENIILNSGDKVLLRHSGTDVMKTTSTGIDVTGYAEVSRSLKQGNSDSTPRTINIPYSNTSGVLTYTFNWTDLALDTNESTGTPSDNAFYFEVNVTCYLHRYVKALIRIDTNLDNSLALTTLSNATLTMTASIPTNSENITINVSNIWGNSTNYMGRITTF